MFLSFERFLSKIFHKVFPHLKERRDVFGCMDETPPLSVRHVEINRSTTLVETGVGRQEPIPQKIVNRRVSVQQKSVSENCYNEELETHATAVRCRICRWIVLSLAK